MKAFLNFLKRQPLLTAIAAIAVALFSLHFSEQQSYLSGGILRMLLSAAMAFFLYLISREKTLDKCDNETWYVIKVLMPFIIMAAVIGAFSVAARLIAGTPTREGWPLLLLTFFYEMIFVGLFEELAFRAIINDAVVYQFRRFKGVFILSAVACSLVFGYVHVMFSDMSTPLMMAQGIMKTVGTGLFGLAALLLYWKTRNIWACAIVHAIFDFLIAFNTSIFESPEAESVGYVVEGEAGVAVLIALSISAIINLLIVIKVWKMIKDQINFEEMREIW